MNYIITSIVVLVTLFTVTFISYTKGYSSGSNTVQLELAERTNQYYEQIRTKEEEYRRSLDELEAKMLSEQKEWNKELSALNRSYTEQLRKSEQRADYYRKLYSERNSSCDLPKHTARLDRALTEGTVLVKELCRHIEYRDSQLRAIGQYLDMENKLHE